MDQLQPAEFIRPPIDVFIEDAMKQGHSKEAATALYHDILNDKVFINDVYQVAVREHFDENDGIVLTHLSIKRRDRETIHDWRDLQEIKNQLCGAEREAIELYPAESRRVDSANQYHLWVFPDGFRLPVGFTERYVTEETFMDSKQRPFE